MHPNSSAFKMTKIIYRYKDRLASEAKLINLGVNGLIKTNNLADLQSFAAARTNLSVYSKTETDTNIDNSAIAVQAAVNAELVANYLNTTQFQQRSYRWDNFVEDPTFSAWNDFVSARQVASDTDAVIQNSNCSVGNTLNTGTLFTSKASFIPDYSLTNYTGNNNSLQVTVNTIQPASPLTGKAQVRWNFEGYKLKLLKDNTVTFYFWLYTNKTGNYSLTLKTTPKTVALTKAYVTQVSISSPNVWTQVSMTVPMNWYQFGSPPDDFFDERIGFQILFTLSADTTVLSTANTNAWSAANVEYLVNQSNCLDSVSNQWYIANAQLEISDSPQQFRNTSSARVLASLSKAGPSENSIINSQYSVNQRAATSYTQTTSTSGYTLDMVNAFGGTNGTGTTVLQGSNTAGLFRPIFSNYLDVTFTGTDAYIRHSIVEDVRQFSGKVVTLSFWANLVSGSATSIKIFLRQYANVTGPVVVDSIIKDFVLTPGTPSLCTATFILPDVSSLTLTASAHLALVFYTSQTSTNQCVPGRMQITGVRLEGGFIATSWYNKSFEDELMACQRYYEKSYDYAIAPGTAANFSGCLSTVSAGNAIGNVQGTVSYRANKRVTPTITLYNPFSGATGSMRRSDNASVAAGTLNIGVQNFTWNSTAISANAPIRHDVHATMSAEF